MKNFSRTLVTSLAVLVSTSALADVSTIRNLPDSGQVTVNGTVDMVKNERKFILRDNTGTINVEIQGNESVVLKQGDDVTVMGNVDKGLIGKDIDATSVKVNKSFTQAVGDAIEGNTKMSLEGATSYNISNLPKEGLVKISGTVTDVDDEKEFTVRDATGSIEIDVKSGESAAVTEGAQVTVIGYVDSGLVGKEIDATKVLVVAEAAPAAGNQ